jgi:hypothetical protein
MPEWLQNPVVYWGLAIGAMFFGYFFGLFEGRGQGYKRGKAEVAEKKESEPTPGAIPPASPPTASDEVPVLDMSMDTGGQLRLKLDGQRIDAAAMSADQRKRIITVLTQMRPWLETSKPGQSPQAVSPGRDRGPNGEAPQPPRPQPAQSQQGASPPQTASPAIADSAPSPVTRPSLSPTPAPKPAAPLPADDKKESATQPQSIVEQVDAILQAQMVGTPLFEKGIRLQESPEGGVLVWVGINKFEGVDGVPDDDIKAAIRAAIAVWENKYTPGL